MNDWIDALEGATIEEKLEGLEYQVKDLALSMHFGDRHAEKMYNDLLEQSANLYIDGLATKHFNSIPRGRNAEYERAANAARKVYEIVASVRRSLLTSIAKHPKTGEAMFAFVWWEDDKLETLTGHLPDDKVDGFHELFRNRMGEELEDFIDGETVYRSYDDQSDFQDDLNAALEYIYGG